VHRDGARGAKNQTFTPGKIERAAPLLGQHTREILLGLGYTSADVERLEAQGAVLCAQREA